MYFFILFLWAFDCIRRDLGDAVISIVLRERAKWLAEEPAIAEHPATLSSAIGSELMEAVEKEMKGVPVDVQIKEYTDVKNAAEKKLASLAVARNAVFGGNIRQIVHDKVESRRAS